MTARGASPGFGGTVLGSVLIFGSLAGAVCGLSLLFLGMRGVMEIGGSCAEGGPYVSARPCPDGTPVAIFGGVWGGLACTAIYAWQTLSRRVPGFLALAWPALFLSLGYNFLDYGLDAPGPGRFEWGFIICAVVFGAMGGLPLVVFLKEIVRMLLPFGHPAPAPARPAPTTRAGAAMAAALPGIRLPRAASAGPVAPVRASGPAAPAPAAVPYPAPERADADSEPVTREIPREVPRARDLEPVFESAPPPPAAHGTVGNDEDSIVTALERLVALRDSGALTDEEFAFAKEILLEGVD